MAILHLRESAILKSQKHFSNFGSNMKKEMQKIRKRKHSLSRCKQ